MERVRQALGFWPSPIMMVSEGGTANEALEHDRQAVAAMESIGPGAGVVAIESLAHWLPPVERQRGSIAYVRAHREAFSPERFRRDVAVALGAGAGPAAGFSAQYVAAVSGVLTPEPRELTIDTLRRFGLDSLVDRHLVRAGDRYLAISNLYLDRFPWADGVVSRFDATVRTGGAAFLGVRFVGDALRGATHADLLRKDIVKATALALSLVAGLLWLQFRRVLPALLCLVPLVAGIAAALGLMALVKIELNVLTLAVAPLLVGLCVDDGIHMMERLEQGESPLTVLHDNGAAMIITTATTIAGFACLGFASFRGMLELGLVGSVGIIVALGASLHLLPVIHAMLVRPGRRRAGVTA
jgi:hypothetical protein